MEKTCSVCNHSKPLAQFNKRAESSDGHTPSCKTCIRFKRQGYAGRGAETTALTEEQKKLVYASAIKRMEAYGLASKKTTEAMMERVKAGFGA